MLDRRRFLGLLGAGLAGAAGARPIGGAAATLPRRVLGRTGVEVSVLAFGAGSHFLSRVGGDEAMVERLVQRALEFGITYFDTAATYSYGGEERLSERLLGRALAPHRDRIFLATKTQARDLDGALRSAERSLKALRTDRLDLLQLHGLESFEELDRIAAPDGALRALERFRDERVVRFIGATGHYDPAVLRAAVERFDLDTLLVSLNAAQSAHPLSMTPGRPLPGFEREVVPAARRKKMGIVAMKVMGQGRLVGDGRATPAELIRYALSLPVAALDIAHTSLEILERNVAAARAFRPMTPAEMAALRRRLEPTAA
jgi:aryl-alcohol dehydrogenase-like predicted oxidoreductase